MTTKTMEMSKLINYPDECPLPDCDGSEVRIIVGFPTAKCTECGYTVK